MKSFKIHNLKFIISIYFILCGLYSFSQFNIIVEDSTSNHLYNQIIIDNNNEFTIINGSGDNLGNRGISFIRTDIYGNIFWEKLYSKQNEIWQEGFNNSFNKNINILSGSIFTDKSRGKLLFLNNNYDTLFTKTLYYDTLKSYFFSISETYDNNFVVAGQLQNTNAGFEGCFVKYNLNGDTLWVKTYGGSQTDMLGYKIIETTADSGFISIGFTYSYDLSSIYKQDWYIVKTDRLGNMDWFLHPGTVNLNDGAARDIIQTQDGNFVVVGGKAVYRDAGGTKFDGRIMKFDINGNILWDKTYRKRLTESNDDSLYCFFNSIVELDDGGFAVVATEQILQGAGHYNNALYRFNNEGDTLWTRHYCTRCEYTTINFPGQEYPSTIQKTENGGFLIGGWGNFSYTFDHPYEQQMFLIKTDSMGCDGTLFTCPDTGTYVIDVVKEKGEFLVYPNPATNSVKCIVNSEELNKNTSVFIYDVYGREIIHKILDLRQKTLKIDVSSLESGVYFIKVGEITRKFIKQ